MKTIAVLFGGQSAEHDVSIVTAISSVIKPLQLLKAYNVVPVYIAKNGNWYSDSSLMDIKLFSSGRIDNFLLTNKPVSITFDDGLKLASKTSGLRARNNEVAIDIVFPALHGTNGEDGALMGLLELANIAYVGCGLQASVVAMDKVLSKQIARASDIEISNFVWFTKDAVSNRLNDIAHEVVEQLSYPLFVKPAHLGSSIGITKVVNDTELRNAMEVAAHYDDKIIVEEAVQNLIEVTLPIMGNAEPRPALLEKPLTAPEDFFDFDTKYMNGGKKGKGSGKSGSEGAQGYSQIPAELPDGLYDEAMSTGLAVYRALGCEGLARVDMLIDTKERKVYFNEINPLPGGLYAHNWNKAGISSVKLVETLVQLAEERHEQRSKLATVFTTNYLQQF